MCLGLDADHAFNIADNEIVACAVVGGSKLLNYGTFRKSHIVLVRRNNFVRILLSGFLDHLEEAAFLLFSVNDECSAENLVAAMLAVDLCETEDLAICEFSTQLVFHVVQIGNFFGAQCQAFLLIVFFQVLDTLDGVRSDVVSKYFLIQTFIEALEHGVILCIGILHWIIFFNSGNALQRHVLRNFHCIGAPRCYHFFARTNEVAFHGCLIHYGGFSIEPTQFFVFFTR